MWTSFSVQVQIPDFAVCSPAVLDLKLHFGVTHFDLTHLVGLMGPEFCEGQLSLFDIVI